MGKHNPPGLIDTISVTFEVILDDGESFNQTQGVRINEKKAWISGEIDEDLGKLVA